MEYTRIEAGRGFDLYRITGDFHGLAYQEIANSIDPNNFGYAIVRAATSYIEIKIYTD